MKNSTFPIISCLLRTCRAIYRFSASVALFGDLLKKSTYTQKATWDELELIARSSYDQHDVSQSEYILLIDKAKKIYHKQKKKKKTVKEE